jgi:hypothetical protein
MPGADDDLAFLGKLGAPAAFAGRDDRRADVPLADRAALMEAMVRYRVNRPIDVEHAYLDASRIQDAPRANAKLFNGTNDVVCHAWFTFFTVL